MASPDYSDGCMIALYPPQPLAEELAVPDGLDPGDMHVTVAYLGDTADVDRDTLLAAAQALAARQPIEAVISGHAQFTGGNQDVIVALVDSPGLEDLRQDVLTALDERDVTIPREHGYTPHLTLTYIDRTAASPVDRIDSRPVNFSAVSAVYGAERTDFRFLLAETVSPELAVENATLQLHNLKGIWRPVYARRQALHATADAIVIAAWRADLHGIDLAPAVAAWRQAIGETVDPATQRRRQAAAAAVLGTLAARPFTRTRAALATAAKRAHRSGWAAGHAIVTQDEGDDSDYDEPDSNPYRIGSPDMSDHAADGTASAVLAAALRGSATRAGRAMADSEDDSEDNADAEDALHDAEDLTLAVDLGVSAAYGAGMLSAYLGAGAGGVMWLTAGDERVCDQCMAYETASPYGLLGAPTLPAHPNCRCCLAPA